MPRFSQVKSFSTFSVSGCTDHFADTEEEGFKCGRDVVATFNIPETVEPEGYDEPVYDPNELLGLIPHAQQHTMDMHKVLSHPIVA